MAAAEQTNTESTWEVPSSLRLELLARLGTDPTRPAKVTYEEFLDWADEDTLAEWVDGSIVMSSPASGRHQDLISFFDNVLGAFVLVHDLGVVRIAPFQMKLAQSGREPDVLFIAKDHVDRLKDTYLDGPADLVIEISSPESVRRDRGEKFYEYSEAGIPEYWLVDPMRQQAAFYQLDAHGYYQPVTVGATGTYRSAILPGFWLKIEWLFQRPLPDPVSALLEIDREAYTEYLMERLRSME